MEKELSVKISLAPEEADQSNQHDSAKLNQLNFSNSTQREAHVRAFLAWLPNVLHEAPDIQWDRLPSRVMGCLMLSASQGPDTIPIALAAGCAIDGMKNTSLFTYCSQLTTLLRRLRGQYGMTELSQLGTRDVWDRFFAGRALTLTETNLLGIYDSFASLHIRRYLEGLDLRHRVNLEQYALPPLPAAFRDRRQQHKAASAATQQRRKEQSDVLVPLFSLLVELAQLRKQAMERFVKEFRRYRERAMRGEIELPYQFQYAHCSFSVSEDASTLADVKLVEKEEMLSLTLWNRLLWTKKHSERYTRNTRRAADLQVGAYAPENNTYFLQYEGPVSGLLWYGDLVRDRRLQRLAESLSQ